MKAEQYIRRTERYLELLKRHENTLFWLCSRYARFRPELARDLLQDIHERLWRTLDALPPDATRGDERAWLIMQARSAKNARLRKEQPAAPIEPLAGSLAYDDSYSEQRQFLDELLALLPDDERHLLQRQCDGYSADELATELGISVDAVYQRLSRARKHLRTIYQNIDNQ